jgi:transposase
MVFRVCIVLLPLFVPPYSPNLKPIEPCFALVKKWLRQHENEALLNPVVFINRAFDIHSIGGERERES